ncbi:MAG TPA: DUF4386 domain-containing protein [Actinomycetota bacterium]|jgi:hypothetical protein|nr:DUF4386 domain-containing protein [Actinomycetota bacterium]
MASTILERVDRGSVKRTARIAGVLYLVIFIVAPFPFLLGRASLVVTGDAAATAENIIESETVFRVGMVAETVVFLVEIVLAALLYVLLRPVSRPLSLAAAFSRVGEAVIQAANLMTSILVLLVLGGSGYLAVFEPDQLDALAMLFLDANEFMILIWGLFFGLHLLLLGYLVYRSGFWPRVLGVLLVAASVGYLAQSWVHIITSRFDDVLSVIVIVLAVPGELAFTVWLLWKGVDVDRWERRAMDASYP